jgi:hypothetical protein
MADGSVKNIEDVEVGDRVVSGEYRPRKVVGRFRRQYDGKMVSIHAGYSQLECTSDHQIRSCVEVKQNAIKCWKSAEQLGQEGGRVYQGLWDVSVGGSKISDAIDETVYDIEVEGDHSFICNGLVVHNCQGHSLTTCCEGAYYMATGGTIAFSRQFAYIGSQKVDNINGDSGSTVSGGVKLATGKGLCREILWPYTGNYHRNPPGGSWEACEQDGANYKIGQYSEIKGYDGAFKFIASRLGWVHTGMMWGDTIDRQAPSGVIERWSPGGGGHSVAFVGYTPEKTDGQGRPYLINVNSWSTRWGNGGYVLWSPAAFDAMCNHQWSEVVGLHSMQLTGGSVLPKVIG